VFYVESAIDNLFVVIDMQIPIDREYDGNRIELSRTLFNRPDSVFVLQVMMTFSKGFFKMFFNTWIQTLKQEVKVENGLMPSKPTQSGSSLSITNR